MDELPELPFEQVLSYLNFKDRLKARTVSKAWRNKFDSYPVKSLCYSQRPSDFIIGKRRWVSGAFAKNFIISSTRFATRFTSFFDTFGQTFLSSLKHLRLCDFNLSKGDRKAFTRTLNSLSQLEQLDLILAGFYQQDEFKLKKLNIIGAGLNQQDVFKLNLPMLTSLQIVNVHGMEKLTLEAPRLREVKILGYYGTDLRVKIVPGESVERLLCDWLGYMEVKNLKNLQYLYGQCLSEAIDSTFISSLQQLKEIHTNDSKSVSELFEQKQQSGRADLKIYLCGLLLNGSDDPAINSYSSGEWLACLTGNRPRLADEIPFYSSLQYSDIEELVSPSQDVDLLKRFTNLNMVKVNRPVKDIERFLNLLKNCKNISSFQCGDQPQGLFDRLPEHCAVQNLRIFFPPSDLAFLFRLKHLIHLDIVWTIDSETVRRALEELPVLSSFTFRYGQRVALIHIDQSKQFQVEVNFNKRTTVSDLNAAIEFIFGKEEPSKTKKRKAGALE